METGGMRIEVAQAKDVPEIVGLVNSAYRGESSKQGWTTEADVLGGQRINAEMLSAEIANPLHRILLIRENEALLACVSLEKFTDERGVGCYLGMMTVRPTIQARGLGRYFIEEAQRYAKNWGATRMTMNVLNTRDELMAWYERRGFKKTGETKPFPYGDEKFGLPKQLGMFFYYFEKSLL